MWKCKIAEVPAERTLLLWVRLTMKGYLYYRVQAAQGETVQHWAPPIGGKDLAWSQPRAFPEWCHLNPAQTPWTCGQRQGKISHWKYKCINYPHSGTPVFPILNKTATQSTSQAPFIQASHCRDISDPFCSHHHKVSHWIQNLLRTVCPSFCHIIAHGPLKHFMMWHSIPL